jgi:hypothetical protein
VARVTVTPPEDDGGMATQLLLIDATSVDWRLDEHTKEIGRQGIAAARDALAQATRRASEGKAA